MTKEQFMHLLGQAYHFPEYYSLNLDSADEILEDLKEEAGQEKLSLRPLFEALLAEATPEEQQKIWELIRDHFSVIEEMREV